MILLNPYVICFDVSEAIFHAGVMLVIYIVSGKFW